MSKQLKVSIHMLNHSSGTKYYTLVGVYDPVTGAAAGMQIWGPNGKYAGKKLVAGSSKEVSDVLLKKVAEKERVKSGDSYKAMLSTTDSHPVSSVVSHIERYLTPEAKGYARLLLDNLGTAFKKVGDERQEEEREAEAAGVKKLEDERKRAYANAWGAF